MAASTPARSTPRRSFRAWRLGAAALVVALAGSCGGDGGTSGSDDASKDAPENVRLTYFGIANWVFQAGKLNIMMDGYMTRIPQSYFSGGGGGLAFTQAAYPIDKAAVDKVNNVIASNSAPINLILTGHSHFDHSFDTPYWAKVTGAQVVGSQTTCFQVRALGVPTAQCTPVNGGETIQLTPWVTMRVVLWNHSGSHEANPEQHDPVELTGVPKPDAAGNLKGGVAEDFPNGGGNRGYLFTVVTKNNGVLSFFVTNSGAPQDLGTDTLVNGTIDYGVPLDSLKKAMADSKLPGVDLWIGAGGAPVASLTVPILHPKVYVPNHLGDFFKAFELGLTSQFADATLTSYLAGQQIALVPPKQYFDAWVLDKTGFHAVDNGAMKSRYGF